MRENQLLSNNCLSLKDRHPPIINGRSIGVLLETLEHHIYQRKTMCLQSHNLLGGTYSLSHFGVKDICQIRRLLFRQYKLIIGFVLLSQTHLQDIPSIPLPIHREYSRGSMKPKPTAKWYCGFLN